MHKSSHSSKGQWFIISAVMISGVFLAISSMMRISFDVDASDVGRRNEYFYFNNMLEQQASIEAKCTPGEGDFARDMKEFEHFSRLFAESRGYFFFMNYTIDGCDARSLGLMIASEKGMFYQNVDPNELIPGII